MQVNHHLIEYDPTGWTKEFTGDIKEYGIKSNIEYNNNDFIVLGSDRKEFAQKDSTNRDYTNNGFFLTNTNHFLNSIFTQSLRYDEYSNFDNKVTGKIGIKHFYNNFIFSSNYGTAYNVPSMNQLYTPTYGNEDLKPESTKSFDISTKYKNFEIRYFKNRINDLIGYDPITYVNEQVDGTSVTLKGL